jgi:hypothetical protein
MNKSLMRPTDAFLGLLTTNSYTQTLRNVGLLHISVRLFSENLRKL